MKYCRTLALCAALLAAGSEARPQDALIACKSKTVQSAFDTLEDCFSYYSKVEPRVKNTAVQEALMSTLLQLEEIEELLDVEEKILENAIAKGEKQHPEANRRRKRDLDTLFNLLGLGGGDGNGSGGLLQGGLGGLLQGLGGEGGDDDNSILGIIRSVKRTIKEIISNLVQLIFGTVGTAISGVTDLLGLDAIFGGSRPATRNPGGGRTGRNYFVI
jgi:hypothetical protein